MSNNRQKPQKTPVLGVGDKLGAGDSYLLTSFLPSDLADVTFEKLKTEVKWQTMSHRGGEVPRLVAVQGEILEDGSFPVYRHPADESPPLLAFSPTVSLIRNHVQTALNHPVNHVLIQYYRTGSDYISDHSDKTIDVVRGSNIVNVSLGAQRNMTLRQKRDKAKPNQIISESPTSEDTQAHSESSLPSVGTPRSAQRIPLPHNSMFVMGLETNAKWLHGINHDNRPLKTKSPEEQVQEGGRISLTFRHIGTFLSQDEKRIWGQGAKQRSQETAGLVIHDQQEVERLIVAFGDENQKSDFDWDAAYGTGFDVLHFTVKAASPENLTKFATNSIGAHASRSDAHAVRDLMTSCSVDVNRDLRPLEAYIRSARMWMHENAADHVTNQALGNSMSMKSQILATGAGLVQEFEPIKNICAFLNAFHVYADQPDRAVESHHYCGHVNEDVRQCLIYDSNEKNARLIGVEYMITPKLYETLDHTERRLWHSHVFEVKSGMLVMPKPSLVPEAAWEVAETKEMEEIIQLYGKVYHFWQVDRGDKLPLGQPQLMTSITKEDQVPGLWERVAERDRKLVADYKRKKALRQNIPEPIIHPDADHYQT